MVSFFLGLVTFNVLLEYSLLKVHRNLVKDTYRKTLID